eukprot:14316373-Heterocapsa_arctica.AAC.1
MAPTQVIRDSVHSTEVTCDAGDQNNLLDDPDQLTMNGIRPAGEHQVWSNELYTETDFVETDFGT